MLMTTMLEPRKKQKTKVVLKYTLTLKSTEFRSFDNLLKIRPKGTRSKNSFREENNKLEIMD